MLRVNSARLRVGAAAACLLAAACSTPKPQNASEYMGNAESMFRSGAYGLAIENYREMIDQYPFDEQTEEAELRIAHAHYLNGAYIEAIASFTDFQRRHPTSPFLPFVGYELGMAYKAQMGTSDRDQTAARNADIYFSALIAQYPDSPYAELAREEAGSCQNSMADHEMYVARWYLMKGNFPAVEHRSLEVVGRFPTSNAAADALYALGRLYEEGDDSRRASLAYTAILQEHPSSSRAPEAKAALERLGVAEDSVGPAAREALLASAAYSATRLDTSAPVEVPGVLKDNRPFAPPSAGGGLGFPSAGPGVGPSTGPPSRGGRGY
jgi:outer membrane protein assembly factor BamD